MISVLNKLRSLSLSKEIATTLFKANSFHTSANLNKKQNSQNTGPTKWMNYNKTVFPPTKEGEEDRKSVS